MYIRRMTKQDIEARIRNQFPDCVLLVEDLTGGGDHFEVRVATKAWQGMTRIQKHQAVMTIFDVELKSGELHALSIKTLDL